MWRVACGMWHVHVACGMFGAAARHRYAMLGTVRVLSTITHLPVRAAVPPQWHSTVPLRLRLSRLVGTRPCLARSMATGQVKVIRPS